MARVVRSSKFRHVFGAANKKDQCYDSIRITKNSFDSTFCSVNPKFVAIVSEAGGGSSFMVLPILKTGRVERDIPTVCGHTAAVLDIQFSPHNDNIIASASEDCTVKIWEIPDDGLEGNLKEPLRELLQHTKKVGFVKWHPTAENVILTAGADHRIIIWNVAAEEALVEIVLPDLIMSVCWDFNGSRVATTCKDKKIRIIDPRSGECIKEGNGHEGSKPSQICFVDGGKLFTTGFSKQSSRQYAVWKEDDLTKPLTLQDIDESNGVLFLLYDNDTNIMYTCGKGDCVIRYFEITNEAPYAYYLSSYQCKIPARGYGLMPKRGCDVNKCEVTRIYRIIATGTCEPTSFTVPRKSDLFQDDLYPDTAAETASMTATQWFDDKMDKGPVLMSMRDSFVGVKPAHSNVRKAMPKTPMSSKAPMPSKMATQTSSMPKAEPATPAKYASGDRNSVEITKQVETPKPVQQPKMPEPVRTVVKEPVQDKEPATPTVTLPEDTTPEEDIDLQAILADLRSIKITVKKHEKRITELETKFAAAEVDDVTDEEEA